ncbi:collagen alpha-1(XIII) chain-like [Melospiza melodia melodia]|uniref:collagen alpha-1(XIII) chain-like n=1 Tax=Melospiza melodia melodia TaxID=1914991 RepID=UPI002FD44FDD
MLEEKSWKGVDEAAFDRGCVAPPRSGDGERCCRLPLLLGSGLPGVSLLSLVLSLLLYFRTSELQSRVSHLEADRPTQLPAWLSADQMETAILGRVDQLLNEKLKFHLPRHREVRDTHQRCNCPAVTLQWDTAPHVQTGARQVACGAPWRVLRELLHV